MLRNLAEGLRSLQRGTEDPDWRYAECRELVRLRCRYEVEFSSGDVTGRGYIVDMSLGGMKLRCLHAPSIGEVVSVVYRTAGLATEHQSVLCKVQWLRTREQDRIQFVGLTFDTSDELLRQSWVRIILKQLGFRPNTVFQRRKFIRAECFVPVSLVDSSSRRIESKLNNLGVQGALVDIPSGPNPGEAVTLHIGPFEELPDFQVEGTVAQQDKRLTGIVFDQLTDQAMTTLGLYLRHLLLHHWES